MIDDAFDWLLEFSDFEKQLRDVIGDRKIFNALVLGCGSSDMSSQLVKRGICQQVTSIDIEESVIEAMKTKHKEDSRLEWLVMAIPDELPETFDLVIDKGTLDAMLCGHDAPGYFKTVFKHMKSLFFLVSLHSDEFLYKLFNFSSLQVHCEVLCETPLRTCLSFTCEQPILYDDVLAGKNIQEAIDWKLQSPMMSQERVDELKHIFIHEFIDLEIVYKQVFTYEERQEYELEDFKSDAALFPREHATKFSFPELIQFMQENQ